MLISNIIKASKYILNIIKDKPTIAIVLGSGFGNIENKIEIILTISYNDIPFFPKTTIKGHSGKLIYGKIFEEKILIMSGRFHYYEGNSMSTIVFPIRVLKYIGIDKLILSNASGGVNRNFKIGDIMFIKDHINLLPEHPLRGNNIETLGPRFVDMQEAYDKKIIEIAEKIAIKNNISYHKGVYVSLQGPTFETPAEYNMINKIGGDAVGMSTIPEVIVAKHMNMRIFALSIITNLGFYHNNKISHEDVLKSSNKSLPAVFLIIKGIIKYLNNTKNL